jgi:anti-sigma factor RsiW
MMECKHAHEMSAYHDGEIPEPSHAALAEHVRGCPVCAAELARLDRLSRLIRATGRPQMSAQALERLHRSVDLQPKVALLHVAEVFTAVAAAILLFSGVWLWRISAAGASAEQIPLWETVAIAPQDLSAAASQEQLAQWIVQDLSRKNGHD